MDNSAAKLYFISSNKGGYMSKKISDDEILKMFVEHKNYRTVMKQTGASYVKIKRILVENNLFKQIHTNTGRKKVIQFNESYFEEIDTQNKAYWMGFIWGDGYISGNKIGISLSLVDKPHLEKLANILGFTGEIHTYNILSGYSIVNADGSPRQYSRIILNSKKMVSDLKKHGLQEKKSLIMKPPKLNSVPENFMPAFLRGIFDANGSVSYSVSKKYPIIHIVGTTGIIQLFKTYLNFDTYPKLYQRKDGCPVYDMKFSSRHKSTKVIDYLYQNSSIENRLDRKYEKYILIQNAYKIQEVQRL